MNEIRKDELAAEDRLAPFNPTCTQAIDTALQLLLPSNAETQDAVLLDVGCGDARLLIEAVRRYDQLRCIGVEQQAELVQRAEQSIQQELTTAGQRRRIQIRQENVLDLLPIDPTSQTPCKNTGSTSLVSEKMSGHDCQNLSLMEDVSLVYLYLLPKGLQRIHPWLEALARRDKGLRVVTYMFQIRPWTPLRVDRSTKGEVPLYVYEFPSR